MHRPALALPEACGKVTGEAMTMKFSPGQLVHHKRFGYRGVVLSVDDKFQGSEDWYERVAVSRPPKDMPWYHVLVHDSSAETYVAERHLEEDESIAPIEHPLVEVFFDEIQGGRYVRNRIMN
jgi:heat shock protein HspQ